MSVIFTLQYIHKQHSTYYLYLINTTTKKQKNKQRHHHLLKRKKLIKITKSMSQPEFCHTEPVVWFLYFGRRNYFFLFWSSITATVSQREICPLPSENMNLLTSFLAHSQPGGKSLCDELLTGTWELLNVFSALRGFLLLTPSTPLDALCTTVLHQ